MLASECPGARIGQRPLTLHAINETMPLEGQAAPTLRADLRKRGVGAGFRPLVTLAMVVHNAAPALRASLPLLLQHTRGCAELLLLLDQCTDDSVEAFAESIAAGFNASRLQRVRLLEQRTPIWEAAGENLLMSSSSPRAAYVLVQPDNLLTSRGWDVQLLRPLAAHADAVGVTGFLAHAFGAATPTLHHLKLR